MSSPEGRAKMNGNKPCLSAGLVAWLVGQLWGALWLCLACQDRQLHPTLIAEGAGLSAVSCLKATAFLVHTCTVLGLKVLVLPELVFFYMDEQPAPSRHTTVWCARPKQISVRDQYWAGPIFMPYETRVASSCENCQACSLAGKAR